MPKTAEHFFEKILDIVFAVAPALATTCLALAFYLSRPHTPADDPADTKYYFANSKYRDITSKFVQRRNRAEQTPWIPITKNQKINDTIAAAIEYGFRDATKQSAHITEPFPQRAYQVLRNDDRFISQC